MYDVCVLHTARRVFTIPYRPCFSRALCYICIALFGAEREFGVKQSHVWGAALHAMPEELWCTLHILHTF